MRRWCRLLGRIRLPLCKSSFSSFCALVVHSRWKGKRNLENETSWSSPDCLALLHCLAESSDDQRTSQDLFSIITFSSISYQCFWQAQLIIHITNSYLHAHDMIRGITGIGEGKGPYISIHDGFIGISKWAGFLPNSDRIILGESILHLVRSFFLAFWFRLFGLVDLFFWAIGAVRRVSKPPRVMRLNTTENTASREAFSILVIPPP